jgi:hypothetical protein
VALGLEQGLHERVGDAQKPDRAYDPSGAGEISRPPPSAAPLIAATTGLPSVSIRRSSALMFLMSCATCSASSARASRSSFRSAPAKKVFLADVMTTPAIESRSASSRSIASESDAVKRWFMVLTDCSGSSSVRTTTPS